LCDIILCCCIIDSIRKQIHRNNIESIKYFNKTELTDVGTIQQQEDADDSPSNFRHTS
jgi:hypothetical protein